jgi:nitroreductase
MIARLVKLPFRILWLIAPWLRPALQNVRRRFRRMAITAWHLRDAAQSWRHMRWPVEDDSYPKLSSELLFQYHKLEKGLCIEGPPRFFGEEPLVATVRLIERWRRAGHRETDPVYLGALETLRAYRDRLSATPPPPERRENVESHLARALDGAPRAPELGTPVDYRRSADGASVVLDGLLEGRRSVRAFLPTAVPPDLVRDAVAAASLSPSACNRQPWRVHVYEDRATIDAMLELQNGNRGFGHTIPKLLVIAADSHAFFDASERHEPYIDAGLFTMSLVLSLQARGVASCCLNWCVSPDHDREAHRRGNIPDRELIVMYLAVGYATPSARTPRSPRREVDSVLMHHSTTIHA